ncbi:MAG: hypothetical protein ABIH72_01700 [archaeon]
MTASVTKIISEISKYNKEPLEEHKLRYDSSSETLEPVYFWILDKMNDDFDEVEKLVDNFTSSPGSGHFSELMGKSTHMQKEAMTTMSTINTLIRSIINIIYDLKEFKIRLGYYDAANSKNESEAQAGVLGLKQLWMDNVDMKRGNTALKAMAAQFSYVTVIDAFMAAKSADDVDKMDLNDRVKRFIKPRIHEFFDWKKRSESELKKRYEIEKTYLKSQVNSLKLYSRWVKPYLKASSQLEMSDQENPALVTAFNTIVFQLTLIGKKPIKVDQSIVDDDLPRAFKNVKLKRKYYSCVLVDFNFRGIPQKAGQHYVFGGRAEVTFRGYTLNDDEIKMLKQKLDDSDLQEGLRLAEGATSESLDQLQEDIEKFIEEDFEDKKEKKSSDDTDPFSALFSGLFKKSGKEEKKIDSGKIDKVKPDNHVESIIRILAEKKVKDQCFGLFNNYKKAHNMANYPTPYDST